MAKATLNIPNPIPSTVTLDLSMEEAQTVYALVGRATGSQQSPRKYSKSVYYALQGVLGYTNPYYHLITDHISFCDFPESD